MLTSNDESWTRRAEETNADGCHGLAIFAACRLYGSLLVSKEIGPLSNNRNTNPQLREMRYEKRVLVIKPNYCWGTCKSDFSPHLDASDVD